MTEPSPTQDPPDRLPRVKIRRLIYPDLPQVVAIERRVFPTPWSLAMFVLELSKQSGICLAATEQKNATADGHAVRGTGLRRRPNRTGQESRLRDALLRTMSPGSYPAGEQQRLVGYLICSRYDTVWHVMNLAVDVDRQRTGLASALLAELYARVDDEGARFTLEVRRSNLVAIHLYEREGFRAAGVRRRYYQDNGEDALVMWRTPATVAQRSGERRPGGWVGQLEDVPNPGPV